MEFEKHDRDFRTLMKQLDDQERELSVRHQDIKALRRNQDALLLEAQNRAGLIKPTRKYVKIAN